MSRAIEADPSSPRYLISEPGVGYRLSPAPAETRLVGYTFSADGGNPRAD